MFDWFENKLTELYNNIDKIFKKGYNYNYEDMTKDELEEIGRQNGIELDKRLKKETLIKQLKELD
jgi:hypothetical protein